jgi:ABC-2 type transport system permease protein
LWELTLAHGNHAPAALVVLGVAALFLGVLPRAIPVTWVLVGYGLFVGTFGPMMDLPQAAFDLSPFSHLAEMPLEEFAFAPVPILLLIAVATAGIGLVALRRRDVETT